MRNKENGWIGAGTKLTPRLFCELLWMPQLWTMRARKAISSPPPPKPHKTTSKTLLREMSFVKDCRSSFHWPASALEAVFILLVF